MKKYFFGLLCVVGMNSALHAQSVNFTIDAGMLETAAGAGVVPAGGLLQLIASPSGTFSAPTSSSYVSGDNVLLASFAMNYSSGVAGETVNHFTGFPLTMTGSYTASAGEKVLLRYYPSLTFANMPATPALNTTYGQVRSDTIEFGASGGDPRETPWVLPAAGAPGVNFDYITTNDPNGGSYSELSAEANNFVLVGMVPEPSTYIFATGLMILTGLRAWSHRRVA